MDHATLVRRLVAVFVRAPAMTPYHKWAEFVIPEYMHMCRDLGLHNFCVVGSLGDDDLIEEIGVHLYLTPLSVSAIPDPAECNASAVLSDICVFSHPADTAAGVAYFTCKGVVEFFMNLAGMPSDQPRKSKAKKSKSRTRISTTNDVYKTLMEALDLVKSAQIATRPESNILKFEPSDLAPAIAEARAALDVACQSFERSGLLNKEE